MLCITTSQNNGDRDCSLKANGCWLEDWASVSPSVNSRVRFDNPVILATLEHPIAEFQGAREW